MTSEGDESENNEKKSEIRRISPTYWSPLEFVEEDKIFDLDDEDFMNEFHSLPPFQKDRKYKGWVLVKRGTFEQGGRTLHYKAVGLPTSTFWKELAQKEGLVTEIPDLSDQDEEE